MYLLKNNLAEVVIVLLKTVYIYNKILVKSSVWIYIFFLEIMFADLVLRIDMESI